MKYFYIILIQAGMFTSVISQQLVIDPVANGSGIKIVSTGSHGLLVENTGLEGIFISNAGRDGIYIGESDDYGFRVANAGFDGFRVANAGFDGFSVLNAGRFGVRVNDPDSTGVFVSNAGHDGIYVHQADHFSMNIQGEDGAPGGERHIAQIYNRSVHENADVLRLQVGRTSPTSSNNFITFYNGGGTKIGEIDGNGIGDVCYNSSGCDYAEYLPVMDRKTPFHPGDVVGVYNGQISHRTQDAVQVMVITDQAAVLGNMPDDNQEDNYQPVSFIGQIAVQVKGIVRAGDWIVPDGNNTGIAIAVPTASLTPDHQIVGRAWESSSDPGLKRINTAVGLDQSAAKNAMIIRMEKELSDQNKKIQFLQDQIDILKGLFNKTGTATDNME